MGLVTRPTKTGNTTTYSAEVQAGFTVIKASEVDADFEAVIDGGVNNIETANINATGLGTAAIANLAITTAKINDLAVTTAKIDNLAVTTGKIANLAVTSAKIADGGTILQFLRNTNGAPGTVTGVTVIVSQAITLARSRVRLFGTINFGLAASTANVTVTLKRGSTIVSTHPDFLVSSDTSVFITHIDTPGPGTFTYNLVAEKTAGAGTLQAVSSAIALDEVV